MPERKNMDNKIYYKIEKIKKTAQGYIFFIASSMGTNFEMPVSPDQYDRFDLDEGEIIDDAHFLKIREEHLFDNARRHAFSILSYGENNKKMLGKTIEVVVDEIVDSTAICRSQYQSPFIDSVVYIENAKGLKPNTYYKVKITEFLDYDFKGEIENE